METASVRTPLFDSSRLTAAARSFGECRRGDVVIIFALAAIMIVALVGGAVDYGRWYLTRTQAQNAMDAAVLAGGRVMQTSNNENQAIAAAEAYFAAMKPGNLGSHSATFSIAEGGTVLRAVLDTTVTTPFLGVINITSFPLYATAEAVLASGANSGTNVEVSLMLDVTGSMAGQKIEDLKTAAKDLIDIVVWDDQSNYTSRIALAPFAARVNVGTYISTVTGLPTSKTFSGQSKKPIVCVTERTGTNEFTDAAPTASNSRVSAYRGNSGTTAVNDSNNYSSNGVCSDPSASEAIMPLTRDRDALKSRINSLSAGGSTAGALGTAWAWYLLSPNWQSIWPTASRPAPYTDLTRTGEHGQPILKKYAVLMTDGIYNTYGGTQYGDTSSQAVTISDKAKQLCTAMKTAGVTVFTVGFQLGGSQLAIGTLKACASREPGDPADAPSHFYNASTGEELRQAFRDIALQIATLRLRS